MNLEQIDIRIAEDGKVTFHVKGMKGKGCTSLTAAIEKALGVVESRDYTSEYYEEQPVQTTSEHKLDQRR